MIDFIFGLFIGWNQKEKSKSHLNVNFSAA